MFSPVKAVIAGLAACMQWLVFGLCGVGLKAGYPLETWVCGATQTELDGWLSSPQPWKSIGKGIQGLRDCEIEKGLIPGVRYVCGCLRGWASSSVGVLSSSISSPSYHLASPSSLIA